MTQTSKNPADLLKELGIRSPQDLDIEAIAEYCGATIRYRPLEGCEARIMGYKDRAIITVNIHSKRSRQRFSGGHELGHWMRDRGTVAFKCDEQSFVRDWSRENAEYRANRFASDLLLPLFMFSPLAHGLPITFASVRQLADAFEMSLTATAIRLVNYGSYPSMLACFGPEGREWFVASPSVRGKLWPVERPGSHTGAFRLLNSGQTQCGDLKDVRADEWINHPHADQYWIKEDSVAIRPQLILALLWWEDEQQLIDFAEWSERDSSRRSDLRSE
jgi:hypothetical protein